MLRSDEVEELNEAMAALANGSPDAAERCRALVEGHSSVQVISTDHITGTFTIKRFDGSTDVYPVTKLLSMMVGWNFSAKMFPKREAPDAD